MEENIMNLYELEHSEEEMRIERKNYLLDKGYIKGISSFDEYMEILQKAKSVTAGSLYSNCYMLPDEIKQLIRKELLFQLFVENGVAFVSDEKSHWKLYLYVDLHKKLFIPRLDKSILVETMYREGNITEEQSKFENILTNTDFHFYLAYDQIELKPTLAPEKFWKKYASLKKFLDNENVKIGSPADEQIPEFEDIYRERMDIYVQKPFSIGERIMQRDKGLLQCVSNSDNEVYVINVNGRIHGGAIAARKDVSSNIYAPALVYDGYKEYYQKVVDDGKESADAVFSFAKGWIAKTNRASRRLHEELGMKYTGRAFNQFIMAGFLY